VSHRTHEDDYCAEEETPSLSHFFIQSAHSKLFSTGLYPEPVQCTFTSCQPVFLTSPFNVNLILSDVVLCHKNLEVKL